MKAFLTNILGGTPNSEETVVQIIAKIDSVYGVTASYANGSNMEPAGNLLAMAMGFSAGSGRMGRCWPSAA